MKSVSLNCPPNVMPPSFSGTIGLGIRHGVPELDLWLLFEFAHGQVSSVGALVVSASTAVPTQILDAKPSIVASATRETWSLVQGNRNTFYRSVSEGRVHLSGNFRIFGRYTPSLIRLTESTDLWESIEALVRSIHQNT